MAEMKERLNEFNSLIRRLGRDYPEQIQAFLAFMKKAESGPALSAKQKELINVGISVAVQCEWCIAFHVSEAANAGATREEIMEAGFLAVVMHGGPGLAYLTPLVRAVEEFTTPEAKVPVAAEA